MKKTIVILLILLFIFTQLAACGQKEPPGSVSLPENIDKLTVSWNGSSRTTFSYTDPAKIKSMAEYLSSLVLETTKKDPTLYDGGGWAITVFSGDETLEMNHYGNMFFQTADKKWWEISYEQAAEFDELIKKMLPDEMPEFIPQTSLFDEWRKAAEKADGTVRFILPDAADNEPAGEILAYRESPRGFTSEEAERIFCALTEDAEICESKDGAEFAQTGVPSDFQFHEEEYYYDENENYANGIVMDWTVIRAECRKEGAPYYMWCANRDDITAPSPNNWWSILNLGICDPATRLWDYASGQAAEFTEEETEQAEELVDGFLREAGLDDRWYRTDPPTTVEESGNFRLVFSLTPETLEDPVLDAEELTGIVPAENEIPEPESYFSVEVSDGRIQMISWHDPVERTADAEPTVDLSEYSLVLPLIQEKLTAQYTREKVEDTFGPIPEEMIPEIRVSSVRFAYEKAAVAGAYQAYSLMPVWILYGTCEINGEKTGEDVPLMTINAIDGEWRIPGEPH